MEKRSTKNSISVIGIGYVGLPITTALANVGYKVVGVDFNKQRVQDLNEKNETDIYEPGVYETLRKCKDSVEFTSDYSYALKNCDTVLITVGTPLKDDGTPNYEYLDSSLASIGKNLRKDQLIILKSTVIPGTTEDHVVSKLEGLSNLKAGKDFYLAFCPERTIEGLALHELYTLPKIVGGINKESTERAAKIFTKLGGKIIKVSSPRIAEMAKLIDNLYRAMNIAFANEVGELCEKLKIDAHEMVSAVNHAYDRTHIYRPGLGADGPCLSKDPGIFRYSAKKYGLKTEMIDSCISKNKYSTLRIADMVKNFVKDRNLTKPKIALIGLTFKGFPITDDLRGSPAVKIYNDLSNNLDSFEFTFYDPLVTNFLGKKTEDSMSNCFKDADVVMFLTNHPRLMNIDVNHIQKHSNKPLLLIDSWGNIQNLEETKPYKDVNFFRIGNGKI